MIATGASPGQGTLHMAPEKAPDGLFASVVIHNRKTNEAVRYTIPDELGPRIIEWNRSLNPSGRFDAVMNAEGIFQAHPVQNPN